MILSHLQNAQRIEELHPRFKEVFDYLRSHDLLQAECGRIELDGDRPVSYTHLTLPTKLEV